MAHNLFLGMYSFQIKKPFSSNLDVIENNDFLSKAYPNHQIKFSEGFAQDIISVLDKKAYKNEQNTLGATLQAQSFNATERTLDILINGGITGIKQFLIDESGNQKILSDKEIVGLKFYARIWLPANTNTGYLFLQRYGSLTIKPIFDSIIKYILKNHEYGLVGNRLIATTTKKRQKEFLKYSTIKDISIVSKRSSHETGAADATSATIKLSNVNLKSKTEIKKEELDAALKNHGFSIGERKYEIKATYEQQVNEDYKEERTVVLDSSEETINVIPNIVIPPDCIDIDNYPIFEKMQKLVDREMDQIKIESKL
jgi:hypothetical protein